VARGETGCTPSTATLVRCQVARLVRPTAGLILRPAFLLEGRERLEADSTNRRPSRMLS